MSLDILSVLKNIFSFLGSALKIIASDHYNNTTINRAQKLFKVFNFFSLNASFCVIFPALSAEYNTEVSEM